MRGRIATRSIAMPPSTCSATKPGCRSIPISSRSSSRCCRPSRTSEARAATAVPTSEHSASVLEDIAAAHREFAALFDISQAISATLGVEDTSRALANHLRELVPHDACAVFLPRDDGAMRAAYVGGIDAGVLRDLVCPRGTGLAARAIEAARPLVNVDPADDLRACGATQPISLASAIVMPLFSGYRAVGALAFYATRPRAFTDDHARLLDYLSSQAASTLSNAVRYEQAHTASLTDALTGLPNTRFLTMHLTQELARAARQGSDLALLLIDLDDFKQINDSVGHHIGDRALREVAKVLQASVRAYDVSARYAGDEFVVMLPECGVDGVEERRFEIAHLLNTLSVPADDGQRVAVRASVGAAVFPLDGDTFEELLAAADARMYANKAHAKSGTSGAVPRPAYGRHTTAARLHW